MKLLKPPPLYFTLTLTGCLLLSMTPAAQGFITLEHERGHQSDIMIDKVHELHWDVAYSYGDDCLPEERNNDEALIAAVTEALQIWLQPLRDYAKRPIVADFRYRLNADRRAVDLSVIFYCKLGQSGAGVGPGAPPEISMRDGVQVTPVFMSFLVHEIGHTFGLADTYLRGLDWGKPELDKGGADHTKGTQPSSIMSGVDIHRGGGLLGRDDKNGIIWLYKATYEGLELRDCFFPDYELEEEPLGCRPKYPLIFALKHGIEAVAILILREDPGLDVNVRDKDGMTALHHAVFNKYTRVVTALLQRDDLKPFLQNNDGQTPLQLATALGRNEIAALIAAHPKALAVDAKRTLTTTWGALKTDK